MALWMMLHPIQDLETFRNGYWILGIWYQTLLYADPLTPIRPCHPPWWSLFRWHYLPSAQSGGGCSRGEKDKWKNAGSRSSFPKFNLTAWKVHWFPDVHVYASVFRNSGSSGQVGWMEGALLNMLILSMFACFVTSFVLLGEDGGC